MKKWLISAVLAMAFAAGCGGGTSTLNGSIIPNFYRGNWAGEWQSQSIDDEGALFISVYADGSVVGEMSRKGGETGVFTGTMQNDGIFRGVAGFGAGGNFDMVGSVVKIGEGMLGSFNYRYLGTVYSASMTLESSETGGGGGGEE